MMEIIKLLPTLLRRYHFSPTLRSSDSPHKYRHGCSPTGEASAAEPALFKASSFLEVHVSVFSQLVCGHSDHIWTVVFAILGLLVHCFIEARGWLSDSRPRRQTMITTIVAMHGGPNGRKLSLKFHINPKAFQRCSSLVYQHI